jgi:serine/threonine protein kinase
MPRCCNPRCQIDYPPGTTECSNPFCQCLLPEAVVAGRYCIETLIGMGGMAAIYRALDFLSTKYIALKISSVSRLSGVDGIEAEKMFYNEALYTHQINHKNIVPTLNFGKDGRYLYLVMPLITGGTLKALLEGEAPLPIVQAQRYLNDLAAAVDVVHAHPQGLIHNDIKPSNLLIHQDDGRLVLTDFGVTRATKSTDSNTRSQGWALGREHYIAPEAEYGKWEIASDIYSMGVVAYQIFTGLLPFQAVVRSRALELPLPSQLNRALPPTVDSIICQAMDINPAKRHRSAGAFAHKLNYDLQLPMEVMDPPSSNVVLYDYDVAFSYAGEDRIYAKALAKELRRREVKIFYDKDEKATLWGQNLYTSLSDIYQNKARYCVVFLSQHYAAKLWTNHERQAAQARALKEKDVYILPIRIDETEIPGFLSTIAYWSWSQEEVTTIADAILAKLKHT